MVTVPTAVVVLALAVYIALDVCFLLLARKLRHRSQALVLAQLRAVRFERMAEEYLTLLHAHALAATVPSCERQLGRAIDEHYERVAAILAPDSLPNPGWCDCTDQTGECPRWNLTDAGRAALMRED